MTKLVVSTFCTNRIGVSVRIDYVLNWLNIYRYFGYHFKCSSGRLYKRNGHSNFKYSSMLDLVKRSNQPIAGCHILKLRIGCVYQRTTNQKVLIVKKLRFWNLKYIRQYIYGYSFIDNIGCVYKSDGRGEYQQGLKYEVLPKLS